MVAFVIIVTLIAVAICAFASPNGYAPGKRADVHRPSAINVADYDIIMYLYLAPQMYSFIDAEERQVLSQLMERNGWTFTQHTHGGTCGVCGASANYVGVFLHKPTRQIIYIGHECAQHVEMCDGSAFDALKRRVRAQQEKIRSTIKARKLIGEYAIPEMECGQYSHKILADMWGKLVKYGSLSPKQIAFAKRLIDERKNPKATGDVKSTEPTPTEPAPTGRVTVTGIILGVKTVEGFYGMQVKMLVRSDAGGWKVWSTKPVALADADKGSHVRFTATLTQSDKDQYFAYAKRPGKATCLDAPVAQPE